ncbi:MAG: AAA family ATPase, partial [Candidatus Dormibacteria bacterium]
ALPSASIDAELVRDTLTKGPGGIRVLLAPSSPEFADLVTADHLGTIMRELRRTFDYIVVDTAPHLGELNLEAIELATRVIVVTALTIPALKDTKLTLRVLETLNIEPDRILLALNRHNAHSEFNREAVERNLRFPIAVQIPHDSPTVSASVNHGAPFVSAHPEAEISRSIGELVSRLVPVEAHAPAVAVPRTADHRRVRRFGFARG